MVISMGEENLIQKFRLKKIEEIKSYFLKELNLNELMSKKHKKSSNGCNKLR